MNATGNHYSGIFTIDQFATSAGSSTRRAGSPPERAARPEPIHQRPKAVRGIRIVVDALDLNVASVRELVRRTFALRSHGSSNPACRGEYSGERRCGVCACEGSDLGLIEE